MGNSDITLRSAYNFASSWLDVARSVERNQVLFRTSIKSSQGYAGADLFLLIITNAEYYLIFNFTAEVIQVVKTRT